MDRFWLRLWFRAEGRALVRMRKRWPVEYRDFQRGDVESSAFLMDAFKHLVIAPEE